MDKILFLLKKYFANKDKIKELRQMRLESIKQLVCDSSVENEIFYKPKANCNCDKCKIMRSYHNKIYNTKMVNYKLMAQIKEIVK